MITDHQDYDFRGKVGIITPYKSQLRELKTRFSTQYGPNIVEDIDFNTTDAFQGRESEVIIFSCVRASPAGGIGFLQDIRRMNVGLTRAKSSLWVLGNSESLARGQYWRKLVEDAKARDSYTTGNLLEMLAKPSSAYKAQPHADISMHDTSSHVSQMNAKSKETAGADRMEGVSYRFEDRVKKRPIEDSKQSEHSRLKTESPKNIDTDVEMRDADGSEAQRPVQQSGKPKLTRPPVDPFMRPKARAR